MFALVCKRFKFNLKGLCFTVEINTLFKRIIQLITLKFNLMLHGIALWRPSLCSWFYMRLRPHTGAICCYHGLFWFVSTSAYFYLFIVNHNSLNYNVNFEDISQNYFVFWTKWTNHILKIQSLLVAYYITQISYETAFV